MRPQLTPMVLFYAVFDGLGMLAFSGGALWLGKKQALFFAGFPASNFDALLLVVGGVALMLWASAQILRELLIRQAERARGGK